MYEGKIKCIYIDPPYNTGNEGWVYNDNVNHPKIKKWLGEVVGKEGDDLSRHDKWLCMMYPRLQLLYKLLADDGIFIASINDYEVHHLRFICDEIFGNQKLLSSFTWRTDGNFDNQAKIKNNHEYLLAYSKKPELFEHPKVVDPNVTENSKLFKPNIINTIVKNGPKNPISKVVLPKGFPANFKKGVIKARDNSWPHYAEDITVRDFKVVKPITAESGWSSKSLFESFISNGFRRVLDTKGQKTKFYLTDTGAIENEKEREEPSHVISSLQNLGNTQSMSSTLSEMGIHFSYPKPVTLIQYLISLLNDNEFTVLDSFAGSGSTAHAVMNLNSVDGGSRKFILIEMEDYANSITAERVKRVINGYGNGKKKVKGTGGAFNYYELGKPLFNKNDLLNEEVDEDKIREYVWYSETKTAFTKAIDHKHLLGIKNGSSYYFYYQKEALTTLDHEFLNTITHKAEQYVIYADNCLLSKKFMQEHSIVFKKIPRDISRF